METGNTLNSASHNNDLILNVSNLTVTEGGRTILENVGFSLERGRTLAVIGPNGAGKTTLFRVLMKLIPYKGTINWHGSSRIGYVPQSLVSTDLPISVEELLDLKSVSNHVECLQSVGLPPGILKHRLSRLSGGELQRVILGWAISDNPDVLLFDEPTSLVDIGAEEPIYQRLAEMKKTMGITIMLISHNLHVVSHFSDYILALNRSQKFYGRTSSVSHKSLIALMSGSADFER